VLPQFLLEGLLLCFIGWVSGAAASTGLALVVNALHIPVVMPGASSVIPIQVDMLFSAFADAFVLSIAPAVAAAFIPALRASKLNITDALRRNI
jgi:ABC-type lipoprotein release transport system permease subunit